MSVGLTAHNNHNRCVNSSGGGFRMASPIICVACMCVMLVCNSIATVLSADDMTYISLGGRDEDQCINGGTDFPCRTLTYIANYLNSNNTSPWRIQIQAPGLDINDTIIFNGTNDVTLAGSPDVVTEVSCDCRECGLRFEHSENIAIRHLTFTNCGHGGLNTSERGRRPAVVVHDCYNFTVEKCHFSNNTGSGLSINNTHGDVALRDSSFQYNGKCSNCEGATGLLIVFESGSSYNNTLYTESNYIIENCNMTKNNDGRKYYDFISGGGIHLEFRGDSTRNTVVLRNVNMEGNGATWGGGMIIQFRNNATHNMVILDRVIFKSNRASKGGGGLDVGYTGSTSSPPITNHVHVENCNFTGNNARYGGGTAIYASQTLCARESDQIDDALVFRSCVWEGNAGSFSSAVDISPFAYDTLGSLYFPHPKFVNCSFVANQHLSRPQDTSGKLVNAGAFMVYGFGVKFEECVTFQEHTETALHMTESSLTFLPGTHTHFLNNSGIQGGAISLYGSSSLCMFPNTTLTFRHNRAQTLGGAIYQSTQNQHDFVSSRTCFIKNRGNYFSHSNTKPVLTFDGNSAGQKDQAGQSMYATTFLPCYFEQFNRWNEGTVMDALQKIAVFDFGEPTKALATAGTVFDFNATMPLVAVPGKIVNIPIKIMDELSNEVPSVYRVVVSGACETDRQYMLNSIAVYGNERTACNLTLVAVSFRESSFGVEIWLQKCPPGFHMQNETCVCSAYSRKHAYYGINTCHDQLSHAFLSNRFWVGYDADNESLLTAPCPSSFCVTNGTLSAILLPQSPSPETLNQAICRPKRTGWLCGKCQPNHTTYYHSPSYRCGPRELCVCGVFFYLLSEIVPIVIMFSVIALFDIRFTTGTASGLVFFAQTIDIVTLNSRWNTESRKYIDILSILYKVVYGVFNFDFFSFEQASFCLWKDATMLDVIAFRYISVVFAFVLLFLIVLFLKYCTCNNCCRLTKLTKKNRLGANRSVIHSMSAVLVICYAQCTNISFQILAKATLRGAGREERHDVTLFGGIHYFRGEHVLYAVAACFCLSTVVVIPPLLLLVYPSYLTIFSLCKLSETRLVVLISNLFIKLKPFFDSFQGCYRDKLRFFSGVYFVSRIAILATNAFVPSNTQSNITIVLIIILILGAYTMFHPFLKSSDNINNGLILLNMSIIGSLTMLAYSQDRYDDQKHVVSAALSIRLILLYLPIACVCIYVIKVAFCWYFPKVRKNNNTDDPSDLTNKSIIDSSRVTIDHEYLPFQDLSIDTSEPAPDNDELSYTYKDREELLAYV